MAWDYKRNESKGGGFKPIPEGKHRIRIKSAEKAVSKTGRDMISLQFEVSNNKGLIFHYIVFMPDKPDVTNRMLTQFFDSFKGIPDGNFDLDKWVGQVGACYVKHEEYNDKVSAKVYYFIKAEEAAGLPAWVEPPKADDGDCGNGGTSTDFVSVPEGSGDSLPFF